LVLPAEWSVTKEEPEPGVACRSMISAAKNPQGTARVSDAALPEPPPLVTATQEAVIKGYAFTVS